MYPATGTSDSTWCIGPCSKSAARRSLACRRGAADEAAIRPNKQAQLSPAWVTFGATGRRRLMISGPTVKNQRPIGPTARPGRRRVRVAGSAPRPSGGDSLDQQFVVGRLHAATLDLQVIGAAAKRLDRQLVRVLLLHFLDVDELPTSRVPDIAE